MKKFILVLFLSLLLNQNIAIAYSYGGTYDNANFVYPANLDVNGILNITSTSTGTKGFNISGGCFAINNVCLAGTGGTNGGTVTSISGSGGTTGLTLTGGPITSSGTLTLGGSLIGLNGGTGLSSVASSSLLIGGANNVWLQFATSSLGLPVFGGTNIWTGTNNFTANTGHGSSTPYATVGIQGTTNQMKPLLAVASSTNGLMYWGVSASGTLMVMTSNASHGNLSYGTTTLVAGLSTVSTQRVQSDSMIRLYHCKTESPITMGAVELFVKTQTAGTSFVASSSSILDTSTICWEILNVVY